MSNHAETQGHAVGNARMFSIVWIWLVVITALEVWLAYIHLDPSLMLILLISMSIVKAALIMSYFMHLRFEKLSLVLLLIPALVFCICMMCVIFPDAYRLLSIGKH
jgi:cytochrome c oxidase subunit 4